LGRIAIKAVDDLESNDIFFARMKDGCIYGSDRGPTIIVPSDRRFTGIQPVLT